MIKKVYYPNNVEELKRAISDIPDDWDMSAYYTTHGEILLKFVSPENAEEIISISL